MIYTAEILKSNLGKVECVEVYYKYFFKDTILRFFEYTFAVSLLFIYLHYLYYDNQNKKNAF